MRTNCRTRENTGVAKSQEGCRSVEFVSWCIILCPELLGAFKLQCIKIAAFLSATYFVSLVTKWLDILFLNGMHSSLHGDQYVLFVT